jgi:hypothetical protein
VDLKGESDSVKKERAKVMELRRFTKRKERIKGLDWRENARYPSTKLNNARSASPVIINASSDKG